MSALRSALGDYLAIRRQLGWELLGAGELLESFVDFAERAGAERITTDLALTWAKLPAQARPYTWRQRLGTVRGFARYLSTIDPSSEVPAKDLLPGHQVRVAPYIYAPAEIAALMDAAQTLMPALHAATFQTLVGLLAATGLRSGEARGLDRADVDLRDGALHVRAAKRKKQREVPLHNSTTQALSDYKRLRERDLPQPKSAAFFLSIHGDRVSRSTFNHTFQKLILRAGLEGRGQRARPRPHDLRHTFAVRTLQSWHQTGQDIDAQLPLLSTYLGHLAPENTYWYLSAAPELMALVAARLDGVLGVQS